MSTPSPGGQGQGDEFDVGELVTWLNDAVLMAPTFLLIPSVSWAEVDDHSIDVTLADSGRSVTARVFLDDQGRPADSSTTDRYLDMAGGLVRTRWTTPVSSWAQAGGCPFPGAASAVWLLPDGPMTYIEGRFDPEKAVFGDRSGTYRATTHLHALLTIEQLFRRVISIQSAARDTHATRVLLFSVLDTLQRLTGRPIETHCSAEYATKTLDRLRASIPAPARDVRDCPTNGGSGSRLTRRA